MTLRRSEDTVKACAELSFMEAAVFKLRANRMAAVGFPRSSYPKFADEIFSRPTSLERCRSGNDRLISYSSCPNTRQEDRASITLSWKLQSNQSWFDSHPAAKSLTWQGDRLPKLCPINKPLRVMWLLFTWLGSLVNVQLGEHAKHKDGTKSALLLWWTPDKANL